MGVNEKTYGMVGLNLPYGKETDDRITAGLGLTIENIPDGLGDYFWKRGLSVSPFKKNQVGTYRYIMDGMNGEYVRLGLLLFESDEYNRVDYAEFSGVDMEAVRFNIKTVFGLDVSVEEIKFFVFTHYS